MATHFTVPRAQIVDTIGRPVSGAKAYFYETGTTTPKDTYSDADLTVAHANPVIADSYGRFPVIYFGPGQYKIAISSPSDVLIYEADDIDPSISSGIGSLPISQGGTGATTAAQARINLGVAAESDVTTLASAVADLQSAALIVGEVRSFAFSSPPSGWRECDGSAISRATYAGLFSAIGTTFGAGDGTNTFNIPDLRGEFLRGWDNGRGIDTSRAIGTAQSEMVGPHTHVVKTGFVGVAGGGAPINYLYPTGTTLTTISTENPTGTETRPRNISLMFAIYAGV